ncbi:MAG: hypothetical protein GY797_01555 [Deltaproteobacteria bacterium]|nr:hypothetical protein [Deltaproteobacteria bacterium]
MKKIYLILIFLLFSGPAWGTDLNADYDFTTWIIYSGAHTITAKSFMVDAEGDAGVYKGFVTITNGVKYRTTVAGTNSGSGVLKVKNGTFATTYLTGFGSRSFVADGQAVAIYIDNGSEDDLLTTTTFRIDTITDRSTYWIGDSFISNTTAIDEAAAITGMTITGAGTSGNTTTQMLARFYTDITVNTPELVGIQGGVNDMAITGTDPNETVRSNVENMANMAVYAGSIPILVNIGPWKNSASWNTDKQDWTESYNTWLASYAASKNYQIVDIYSILDTNGDDELDAVYDSGDGVHPNTAGYKKMGSGYADAIDALIGVTVPNVNYTITEDDFNPLRYSLDSNVTLILKGGGHVDLSNLSVENPTIKCKLRSKQLNQFTPVSSSTILQGSAGNRMLWIGGPSGIY